MAEKRGRPKKFNSRSENYRLRLTKEEMYILDTICKKEHMTKAEILREGLRIVNNLSKNGRIIGYPKNKKYDEYSDNDDNFY